MVSSQPKCLSYPLAHEDPHSRVDEAPQQRASHCRLASHLTQPSSRARSHRMSSMTTDGWCHFYCRDETANTRLRALVVPSRKHSAPLVSTVRALEHRPTSSRERVLKEHVWAAWQTAASKISLTSSLHSGEPGTWSRSTQLLFKNQGHTRVANVVYLTISVRYRSFSELSPVELSRNLREGVPEFG